MSSPCSQGHQGRVSELGSNYPSLGGGTYTNEWKGLGPSSNSGHADPDPGLAALLSAPGALAGNAAAL